MRFQDPPTRRRVSPTSGPALATKSIYGSSPPDINQTDPLPEPFKITTPTHMFFPTCKLKAAHEPPFEALTRRYVTSTVGRGYLRDMKPFAPRTCSGMVPVPSKVRQNLKILRMAHVDRRPYNEII